MGGSVQLLNDIGKLWERYGASYLKGIQATLVLALVATALGCLIGFGCGLLNTLPVSKGDSRLKRVSLGLIRGIIRLYVEVFRGTPMVLQAVFFYYGLPYVTGNAVKFTSAWLASITVVSINTGAYMTESVRGGILSVDPGQTEGAKAIGMNHYQAMTSVILPQALRNIMPQIGNNFIINVKDTSVMFIIGFPDFFAAHRAATGATYLYFPSAMVEMAGYLSLTLIASFLLRGLERLMDGKSSYELAARDPLIMAAGTHRHPRVPG
ncbi:MAG TPA: amino acid ABC transporter permease [Bacillota bacterium]|jgi:putative lysine transport system permease protein|nr:amino acid ABC transporter permease [Fastidiosipila sp.]HPX92592.1 amino acid ABC transporter permease [Bacillota bacterium]HQB81140.1 amino acid ABC transporter permease [Bacillota bacterium]